MKVIAGIFRGRVIPFSNKKFNNADITPQKIKGALFSILGEDLSGKWFMDLYACSGQVGMEAVSRGAAIVLFNEIDKKRYSFIKNLVEDWGCSDSTIILSMPAHRCIRYAGSREYLFDILFCDPPYDKKGSGRHLYRKLLSEIHDSAILKREGVLILQHFSKNVVPEKEGDLELVRTKNYGTSSLSEYTYKD